MGQLQVSSPSDNVLIGFTILMESNQPKNFTWPLYRKAAGLPEMILPLNQSLYGCKLEEGPLLMIFSLFLVKVNLVH